MSKSIAQIKTEFEHASVEERRKLYQVYAQDDRQGVRNLSLIHI